MCGGPLYISPESFCLPAPQGPQPCRGGRPTTALVPLAWTNHRHQNVYLNRWEPREEEVWCTHYPRSITWRSSPRMGSSQTGQGRTLSRILGWCAKRSASFYFSALILFGLGRRISPGAGAVPDRYFGEADEWSLADSGRSLLGRLVSGHREEYKGRVFVLKYIQSGEQHTEYGKNTTRTSRPPDNKGACHVFPSTEKATIQAYKQGGINR